MTQDLAKLHHISERQEQAYVRFAMRGAKRQVVTSRERRSGGVLDGKGFCDFYGWLRAARGAGS